MKNKLALFDFDGTLTKKDSFVSFFTHASGRFRFILISVMLSPVIAGYYLGITSGHRLKESYLRYLLRNRSVNEIQQIAISYAQEIAPSIMNEKVLNKLNELRDNGFRCIVVSASMDIWLNAWGEKNEFEIICTHAEIVDGIYTGKLSTPDCVGVEKVFRIKRHLSLPEYTEVVVYGNAPDAEMLELATAEDLRVLI